MTTPDTETLNKIFEISSALSILTGLASWWRKGSEAEDAMVSAAADTVLDALSDADTVRKIDVVTESNLREQVSVAEAMELHRERELRRFGRRN